MEEQTKYILTSFQFDKDGISMEKALLFEAVLSSKVLIDSQRRASGKTLEEIVVKTETGEETWYLLTLWYAGGDDADEWCNVFDNINKAKEAYNHYT